jgi:Mn-dependent DtxR family transcriptional regulator
MKPSVAMREYLAEIYRLQEDEPTVSTMSLAERLGSQRQPYHACSSG